MTSNNYRKVDVPDEWVELALPSWVHGGNPASFRQRCQWQAKQANGHWRVRTKEAYERRHAALITADLIADPRRSDQKWDVLRDDPRELGAGWLTEQTFSPEVMSLVDERVNAPHRDVLSYYEALRSQLLTSQPDDFPDLVGQYWEQGVGHTTIEGTPVAPATRIWAIHNSEALRARIAVIRVMMTSDAGQTHADIRQREEQRQSLFPTASGHLAGFLTYETFVAPLMLVRAPWAWAFTITRGRILVLFDFGTTLPGRHRVPELLPSGASQSIYTNKSRPTVDPAETEAGLRWWVARLNDLFTVITDPVLFRDSAGRYVPSDHLHLVMNIEHLFRHCSGAMSQTDTHSSRQLMFNFIDTLASVSAVDHTKLYTLATVDKRLQTLRDEMPPQAARFLLPPADAAREALRAVQDGFVFGVDPDRARISLGGASLSESLALSTAAAKYLKLMRNATHGFGGKSRGTGQAQLEQNRHLVAYHSGELPEELHLLGYLHLLYFLATPEALRSRLVR